MSPIHDQTAGQALVSAELSGPIDVAVAPAERVLEELIIAARCMDMVGAALEPSYRLRVERAHAALLARLPQSGSIAPVAVTDAMVERLARHLWNSGVIHRTPPTTWERLEHGARRQWLEIAREYLTAAFA